MKRITNQINTNDTDPASLSRRVGEVVTLCGVIYKVRLMSGFAFVILKTRTQLLQCVCDLPTENLREGAWVRLTGKVLAEPRSKTGYEVRIERIEALSQPAEEPPVVVNNKEMNASLSTLLDYRPLTLRNEKETAIFRVQSELCKGIRRFLDGQGFVEIHSPKIVGGNAEGGANVFGLDYFGKPAFLAQSPQFYKQTMVGVFERVYEIAPVFRAEKHHTARHINEYTGVDLEMGFIHSFEELMALETAMLGSVFEHLKASCEKELALWKMELPVVDSIPAIPFEEAKEWVAREYGRPITDVYDFEPEEERLLGELVKRETGSEFVFVTHYKTAKRPFYTMETPGNPEVTESFDLLFRGMEITTGGQRIHDYHAQVAKMERLGMEVTAFEGYLMAHKYGLPPHGGLGIGLERLTARLLGLDNLRRAVLFPRDTERLTP
ncbi:MAG: aspartate--tRNA(Asn) ligase [Ruminococcaceae bacterium]|nr:aspartate--tRNA(Asn) ligase [Oscillospiraceae bacterium]